jgi:CRP-like cAMP-binding protein
VADRDLRDELIPLLRGVRIFSRCDDLDLKVVAREVDVREVGADEKVIAMGEDTSEMFLVLRGGAQAVAAGDVRATFGPGDVFGELAALVPAPRTTDVVTTAPSTLGVLNRGQVYLLTDAIPGVGRKMIEALAAHLRDEYVVNPA